MNKYQRIVVIITAVNIALMFLFPPFLDNPLRRGVMPSFDGFYPLFSALGYKRLHTSLLTLEVMFVVINVLLAWLLLDRRTAKGAVPEFNYTRAIVLFAGGNLAVLAMFPPFESLFLAAPRSRRRASTASTSSSATSSNRNIFIPLLYFEIILVVINCSSSGCSFNAVRRDDAVRQGEDSRAGPGPAAECPGRGLGDPRLQGLHPVGEADARRSRAPIWASARPAQAQDPRYRGPERRKGGDRRLKTAHGPEPRRLISREDF
jgi:hypothetical protein